MAKTKQHQPKSFEQAITELETILTEMERGEVPLEESLIRYERGTYLLQYCRQVLNKAESQIQSLTQSPNATSDTLPDPNLPHPTEESTE